MKSKSLYLMGTGEKVFLTVVGLGLASVSGMYCWRLIRNEAIFGKGIGSFTGPVEEKAVTDSWAKIGNLSPTLNKSKGEFFVNVDLDIWAKLSQQDRCNLATHMKWLADHPLTMMNSTTSNQNNLEAPPANSAQLNWSINVVVKRVDNITLLESFPAVSNQTMKTYMALPNTTSWIGDIPPAFKLQPSGNQAMLDKVPAMLALVNAKAKMLGIDGWPTLLPNPYDGKEPSYSNKDLGNSIINLVFSNPRAELFPGKNPSTWDACILAASQGINQGKLVLIEDLFGSCTMIPLDIGEFPDWHNVIGWSKGKYGSTLRIGPEASDSGSSFVYRPPLGMIPIVDAITDSKDEAIIGGSDTMGHERALRVQDWATAKVIGQDEEYVWFQAGLKTYAVKTDEWAKWKPILSEWILSHGNS
jgi:hypothetical protein